MQEDADLAAVRVRRVAVPRAPPHHIRLPLLRASTDRGFSGQPGGTCQGYVFRCDKHLRKWDTQDSKLCVWLRILYNTGARSSKPVRRAAQQCQSEVGYVFRGLDAFRPAEWTNPHYISMAVCLLNLGEIPWCELAFHPKTRY